jgi:hypothetical protein
VKSNRLIEFGTADARGRRFAASSRQEMVGYDGLTEHPAS